MEEKGIKTTTLEVLEILSDYALMQFQDKEYKIPRFLLPKSLTVGDRIIVESEQLELYETAKNKQAKEILNEILNVN